MTTARHHLGNRRVFFDLETGGLCPKTHPILQIGAVAYDQNWVELQRFEVKVKVNEADCDPEALKKNHYDRALWAQHGVEPITAHQRFVYFLREHATVKKVSARTHKPYAHAQLFAHNAQFDRDFLWDWHDRLKERHPSAYLPAEWHVICTYQKALDFFHQNPDFPRPQNYQLGTLCNYFGIPFSVNESHDALYDCPPVASLYYTLTEAPQIQVKAA